MKTAHRARGNDRIRVARTASDIRRCHPVMRELRPQFVAAGEFVKQVTRQQKQGYRLAFLEATGEVRAVAGYRFLESLVSGKFLYVDDLVTRDADRSRGFGGCLLDWLIEQARKEGCQNLELDSGVQRFDAHRFYLLKRMHISSYHFRIALESA
jgi:GNAT superfamily N-acetyltransferase